jgi:osmotically inducible lipoprotein OsmB
MRFPTKSNRRGEFEMLRTIHFATPALAGIALAIAACGNNPTDRALTGGAIGAGSGAVIGSTVGSPIAGAVVGGAAGAVVGAATTPNRDYYYYR